MDYGKTLHLPETEFPMRGNLPKREPEILKFWEDNKIYQKRLELRKDAKPFILHDGPPYANGKLHIGHALNKTLKDIIMKYKTMTGHYTRYIPGWDTHGLPIEHAVIKNTGLNRHEMAPLDLRNKCKEYALECVETQKQDFIRFGVLGEWDRPYLTLRPEFEVKQLGIFGEMAKRGHIYKGLKTVYWCTHCETALAEAEIEYAEKKSFSIYVKFPYVSEKKVTLPAGVDPKQAFAVIWTTTPWTMPANVAISVNPELEYGWVKAGDEYYLMATELVDAAMKDIGIEDYEIVNRFSGADLELAEFKHPFVERTSTVLCGDHVTLEAGTGCVHTAPAHGEDDFNIVMRYNKEGKTELPIISLVNETGNYTKQVDDNRYGDTEFPLAGVEIHDAEVPVIKILAHNNALLHKSSLRHQYAHCWRCKNPVIYRATEQWFSSVDGYRQQALDAIDNQVQWIPKWGHDRIFNMVRDRGDWVISRQRIWGVPIPIYYCESCGEHIINDDTIKALQEKVAVEGSDAWWAHSAKELLPEGFKCPHCGHDEFKKETDIMDVWFDSGSTHSSVVDVRPEFAGHAADMYLEGSDQHRGWFMSSLMISTAMKGKAPYRQVLTHGFTVDGQGRKMSKSIGNTVSPQDVMNKLGADILRLWVASTDYTGEMAVSDEILKRAADSYRRIRNTARFLLANLNGFDPVKDMVKPEEMVVLDRWAVGCAKAAQEDILKAYESYDFHEVVQRLMRFCSIEMGSFYLDIIKDRQYTAKADSVARRSCQTALFHIVEALVRWMAPIMSFTADEIWGYLPGEREKYVFTGEWYEGLFGLADDEAMNDGFWDELLKVRGEVNKVIEQARADKKVGGSLEAAVTLYADADLAAKLNALGDELRFVLLTSGANVADYAQAPADAWQSDLLKGLKVVLSKAEGEKCPRCWHYTSDVGKVAEHAEICGRCVSNVAGNGEQRKFA